MFADFLADLLFWRMLHVVSWLVSLWYYNACIYPVLSYVNGVLIRSYEMLYETTVRIVHSIMDRALLLPISVCRDFIIQ